MMLLVNSYQFGGVSSEHNSDDGVSETDRHRYWEGLDAQFYQRLRSGTIFYADCHHRIGTSNHSFTMSTRSSIDILLMNRGKPSTNLVS